MDYLVEEDQAGLQPSNVYQEASYNVNQQAHQTVTSSCAAAAAAAARSLLLVHTHMHCHSTTPLVYGFLITNTLR
jgi:hypothetical protein